jgi:hypothetical protein
VFDFRHKSIKRYARASLDPLKLAMISGQGDIRMLARDKHLKAGELVSESCVRPALLSGAAARDADCRS